MSELPTEVNLRCTACGHNCHFDLPRMLFALQSQGKLRRAEDPSAELIVELFHTSFPAMACQSCGAPAYELGEVDQWDDTDASTRRCERCHQPIDPDRLQIFPNTVLCMACQRREEINPGGGEEPDFCPRCGGLMKLRGSSRGLVKYTLVCGDCGYR